MGFVSWLDPDWHNTASKGGRETEVISKQLLSLIWKSKPRWRHLPERSGRWGWEVAWGYQCSLPQRAQKVRIQGNRSFSLWTNVWPGKKKKLIKKEGRFDSLGSSSSSLPAVSSVSICCVSTSRVSKASLGGGQSHFWNSNRKSSIDPPPAEVVTVIF